MKFQFTLIAGLIFPALLMAQKETFDIATYNKLKGWVKKTTPAAVQFTKENAETGSFCLVTLYKSIAATNQPRENFDASWENLVKEAVAISTAPEMQPSAVENGWEVQSGYAPFESGDTKGLALLVSATGTDKLVNIVVITNTVDYEKEVTAFLESVTLKKPAAQKTIAKTIPANQPQKAIPTAGYKFNTTNFDDGWTSTVQSDWIETTKGNIRLLIHYPNKNADAYNSVVLDGLKNAWNILVAPKYSSVSQLVFRPITGWEVIEYAEAYGVDAATGKNVYIVFFKKNHSNGNGRYMEFITPDKQTFEKEFGPYHENTIGWEKMENMAGRNKFAIGQGDLSGKWTTNYSGAITYVNAYTGFDAGTNTHASNENFQFAAGNTYKWDLGVASGAVGNIKFQSAKSAGKYSHPDNWSVRFSDMEGKPRTFNAYFSCVKGLRVLWLDGKAYFKVE